MKENSTIDQEDEKFEEFERSKNMLTRLGSVDGNTVEEGGSLLPLNYDYDGDVLVQVKVPYPRHQ